MAKKRKYSNEELQSLFGVAKKHYNRLSNKRSGLEQTWRDCSALTLPYIFPDEDMDESVTLPTPMSNVGTTGVNMLASKLLLTLLPFTNSFFRLLPFEEDIKDLDEKALAEIDKRLSELENQIIQLVDTQALRVPLVEALKYLIITGNVLVYKVPGSGIKLFSPYQYTVERDYIGNVLRIYIKEKISLAILPEEIQSLHSDKYKDQEEMLEAEVDIYTVITRLNEKEFITYQETADTVIENTKKTYKKDLLPYIVLRWTSVANEDYGRGLVEQNLGDIRSLEGITQMIIEGIGAIAKTIMGVKPGSMTRLKDVEDAKNGDVIMGDLEKDLTMMQNGSKATDFSVVGNLANQIEVRVSKAFLLTSGNIRDSDRTTATEVRATMAELEAGLGGTYSVLASELQLPLIKLLLNELDDKFSDITEPSIITGVSAISREKDFQNLNTMMSVMAQLGPDVIAQNLNVTGYLKAVSTSLGMNSDEIINSPEEKAKQQAIQQGVQGQQPGTDQMLPSEDGQPPIQ